MSDEALKKLTKARAHLLFDFPFFGVLALKLRYKEVSPRICHSMGVDGVTLFYNPAFIDALPIKELAGVLAHETLHCGLAHIHRRFHRDPKKWNYACDYAIDPLVKASGLPLPTLELDGIKYVPHIDSKYDNKSADEIYKLLPDPPSITIQIQQSGDGEGEGESEGGQGQSDQKDKDGKDPYESEGLGECFDSPQTGTGKNPSPDDKNNQGQGLSMDQLQQAANRAEHDWRMAMNEAAQTAKEQGKLPGHLEQLIEQINKPKIDWVGVLRTFMTDIRKDDFIWSRPNRRHICNDLFLPMRHSEGMGEVIVAVDTSGSISPSELAQFAGEFNSILDDVKPAKVHILYADTHVRHTDTFEPEDFPVQLHKYGGGGTDFTDPFLWTEKHASSPECLIYLTDGYGSCSAPRPPYPTLWVCTSSHEGFNPFGQVLPLEITENDDAY